MRSMDHRIKHRLVLAPITREMISTPDRRELGRKKVVNNVWSECTQQIGKIAGMQPSMYFRTTSMFVASDALMPVLLLVL